MEQSLQDVRLALRSLLRSPGFTTVALLTLALGMGANTAMFTIVNGVLLRPLPYAQADDLVRLYQASPKHGLRNSRLSFRDFEDWRAQTRSFAAMAAYDVVPQILTGGGDAIELQAAYITGDFFSTLGTQAVLGRALVAADYRQSGRNVVISDRLWQTRFAGDPRVLNSSILLRGESFTVLGVMPANFRFPTPETDLWIPESVLTDDAIGPRVRDNRVFEAVARLNPDTTVERGAIDLKAVVARLAAEHPQTNADWNDATVVPLRTAIVGDVDRALVLVLAVVGFILLIGCANLANLLLARATARSNDIGIRTALGASRARIVRQILTESLVLSFLGGALGLLFSLWGVHAVLALSADTLPRVHDVRIDASVFGFGFLLALVTGLLFGLLPAVRVTDADSWHTLKGTRGIAGHGQRVRSALVIAEVAVTGVLVVGAALMARSFLELRSTNPGFNPDNVLTVSLRLHVFGVPSSEITPRLVRRRTDILEGVRRLPGVVAVGMTDQFPLRDEGSVFEYKGVQGGASLRADTRHVSPQYIRTMGIPVLRGSSLPDPWPPAGTTLPAMVRQGIPLPMVISDTAARRFWPDRDPIGQVLDAGWAKVVVTGVVGDVRQHGLARETMPTVYLPQLPRLMATLVVRTAGDSQALVGPVRQVIRDVSPDQPILAVATLRDVMWDSIARDRFFTLLYGVFGALALVLAAVGIYGVLAYSVSQRTQEIGVRMALGARGSDVVRLVVGGGMRLVGVGVVIGAVASLALARMLQSQLFGVSASDPAAFVMAGAVLAAVAMLACYVPARRATRIDPIAALRSE